MYKLMFEIDRERQSIAFKSDNNRMFKISFQGNLDLYFSFYSLDKDNNNISFLIEKDNYQVWEIFDRLYNSLMNCEIFEFVEDDQKYIFLMAEIEGVDYQEKLKSEKERIKSLNKSLKETEEYKRLVNNGIITWKSDDYRLDIAPFFKIEKVGEDYLISFGVPEVERELTFEEKMMVNDWRYVRFMNVRLRNSGSRFDPFNLAFMEAFNSLMALEDNNQIHIEESSTNNNLKKVPFERVLKK